MKRNLLLLCLISSFLLFVFACFSVSEAQTPDEYEVKAVFLFNFTQFIEWPSDAFTSPESPISICVIGPDPFGDALDEVVRGEQVHNRRLSIKRYKGTEDEYVCHIAYISGQTNNPAAIADHFRGQRVVTVSDAPAFAESGGMIAFRTVNNRIRIRINLSAVEQGGVNVSSKLLRLAETIKGTP